MRKFAIICLAALCMSVNAAPVFLKATATGDGSGSSWANACTSVADAIGKLNAAAPGDRVLYVAQGLYPFAASMDVSASDFSIQGGYLGETDGDMTRDPELYQTIFTGDTDLNDCIRPTKGLDTTYSQVVYNGIKAIDAQQHLYLPETRTANWDCEEHGFYMLFKQGASAAVTSLLSLGASGTLSGVCFYGLATSKGAFVTITDSADGTVFDDCTFAYGYEVSAISAFAPITVTNCRFENNFTHWTPVVSLAADSLVSNCVFRGNSGATANTGNIFTFNGKGNLVADCLFERCNAWVSGGFTKAANICYAPAAGGGAFVDCTITNCLSGPGAVSVTASHSLFTMLGGGAVTNCTFAGNRTAVNAVANGGYGLIAPLCTGAHTFEASGCRFLNNIVSAAPKTTEACNYVMGVIGNGFDGQCDIVKNCVFDGNAFEWIESEGVEPIISRSAFTIATAANSKSKLEFVNNTVAGIRPSGSYEIVQYGTLHAQTLAVWNSLFTSPETVLENPFYADKPLLWDVRFCTIRNLTAAYWPEDIDISAGFSYDDIPIAPDYTPCARTPGIRDTTDGSVRGAVNALTSAAENGYTLTVRCSPVASATLSTPSTQAVLPADATAPVTATGIGGASVLGWYDEDDVLITSAGTLPAQYLTDDAIVTAKFGMPMTIFRFDLGECGTFTATGTSQATVSAGAGSAFPGVPEFTIDDENWVFLGWNQSIPPVMPNDGMTFTASYATKQLRVIRVVPSHDVPPSREDGLTWETAYTDIGAAYRDAAAYQGEVWLREGTYAPAGSIPMLSRVKVIGGFAGTETTADEADPEAHDTVITMNGAVFTADSGEVVAPKFAGLHFRDVKNSAIRVNGATVTGLEIDHCVFEKCNTAKASDFGPVGVKACAATLRDCTFIHSYHCAYFVGTTADTPVAIDGCSFVGNDGANYGTCVYIEGNGALTVTNTLFDCNTNNTHNCSGSATISVCSSSTAHKIQDCAFTGNAIAGTCSANVNIASGAVTIEGCAFVGNILSAKNSASTSHSATIHSGSSRTTVKDCAFVGNRVDTPAAASHRSVFFIGANQTTALNCTFDHNVIVRAEGDTGVTALMQFFSHNQGMALTHCTIADTVLPEGCAEIDCAGSDANSYQNCALSFVNTVLWNDKADYTPVNLAGKDIPLWVQHAVVKGLDTNLFSRLVVCTNLVTDVNPKLSASVREGPNGNLARPLSGLTPFVKFGCRTWYAPETGLAYAYNPASKKYISLSKVSSTGLPSGLSPDDPPPADAWGQPRAERAISLGAVNATEASTMILLR